MSTLAEHIINKYESFTIEHCGEFKKCDQPQQERMSLYREQIKLAKEANNAIRTFAHLKELDTC